MTSQAGVGAFGVCAVERTVLSTGRIAAVTEGLRLAACIPCVLCLSLPVPLSASLRAELSWLGGGFRYNIVWTVRTLSSSGCPTLLLASETASFYNATQQPAANPCLYVVPLQSGIPMCHWSPDRCSVRALCSEVHKSSHLLIGSWAYNKCLTYESLHQMQSPVLESLVHYRHLPVMFRALL